MHEDRTGWLEDRRCRWISVLSIAIAGALVYANALDGPLVFDDIETIRDNPNIRSLTPLGDAFSGGPGTGAAGRPLVAFSFALNYALGELDVFGYRLLHLFAHLATALALFGLTRRALARSPLAERAGALALGSALVWVVHPLNTDALNHLASRGEVFLALFYLTTLYAAERAFVAQDGRRWLLVAVLSCAAAMASKEVAVSLPLAVWAYDRSFFSGSFAAALARRRGFYAALAATWILLVLVVTSSDRGQAVGFGTALSSLDYLRTSAGALLHYLRLALWPSGLSMDHAGWPPVRSWGPALLPGLVVLVLCVASGALLARKRLAGFAGLAFFAVLAPSSSFIPISGEWVGEHRMYLPLAFLVALLVPLAFLGLRRMAGARAGPFAAALLVIGLAPLAWATVERNRDWGSAIGLWQDALEKYPENPRAHGNLAALLLEQQRFEEALPHAEASLRLAPEQRTAEYNLGATLQGLGRRDEALEHFARAAQQMADDALFQANYGAALAQAGRRPEAIEHLSRATRLAPDFGPPHKNLALLLVREGRSKEAIPHFQKALQASADAQLVAVVVRVLASDPDDEVRDGVEALRLARALIAAGATDAQNHDLLAMAHAELGQFDEALAELERAIEAARAEADEELVAEFEARRYLYAAETPYRSPAAGE